MVVESLAVESIQASGKQTFWLAGRQIPKINLGSPPSFKGTNPVVFGRIPGGSLNNGATMGPHSGQLCFFEEGFLH